MSNLLAVLAGALYSLAYVAPYPYYVIALGISMFFVVLMRNV